MGMISILLVKYLLVIYFSLLDLLFSQITYYLQHSWLPALDFKGFSSQVVDILYSYLVSSSSMLKHHPIQEFCQPSSMPQAAKICRCFSARSVTHSTHIH